MKPVRYEYPKLLSEIDQFLADPFAGLGNISRLLEGFGSRLGSGENRLATDLYEDDHHYYVRFELPGVKREEIKVEVDAGVLNVRHDRSVDEDGRREATSYRRAVRLPDGVDASKISAKLEDGLLTVTVAKAEDRKPRSVAIH